ncbi:carbohydrate ABC transporter permease [Lacrimispora algidixylanolytica]|uniref:Maltose/maltodextrin transport system permease protein n=1 Tax=Lacrimispora algidixylanolytica TaxID=94868 RepID=A0A419STW2_9FIRM|nr:sugar ABC transporter permease [Lacrimispora algidixylanolytica]RKD28596.1 sugar ABC transporter permease [Lacrimispora algidixylanolytica]
MARRKGKKSNINTSLRDIGGIASFIQGNGITKLSALVFGLGNLVHKQIIRGLLMLFVEIVYIYYMITVGFNSIADFITLGTGVQAEAFNEAKQIYEYVPGDNSMLCLLYGVVTIFLTLGFALFAMTSVRSAYVTQKKIEYGEAIPSFKDDLASLKEQNLHKSLLFLPVSGVLCFTIVPLVFMILIAFTNYDKNHQTPGNLFDWVGFKNFSAMFAQNGSLSNTFWPVLNWTIIWAVFATFSCYIFGMLLAIVINREGTRYKKFWRFIFIMSIAVPQFVSLLTMRTIFNTNGPVNAMLRNIGIIGPTEAIPFFTDSTLAKITIICINVWIGVPFSMLTTTGILQNIPKDLYEAAKVDGANAIVIFFKITLPYMLFITTPYLITSFVGNINNFNVIFLLSGGGPESLEYYYAGKTDLLVTWLYKLTITNKDYNLGAVIGIVVFIILAILSLLTYRHTGSYKDEEAFQ